MGIMSLESSVMKTLLSRQLDVLSCLSILVEQFRRLAVGNEEERREGHLSLGD
jgi:hypothetical protein